MRISDWSSDVCSSDLTWLRRPMPQCAARRAPRQAPDQRSSAKMPMAAAKIAAWAPRLQGSPGKLPPNDGIVPRSEEHTSELQSLMRISYAVFCLTKKKRPDAWKKRQKRPPHKI